MSQSRIAAAALAIVLTVTIAAVAPAHLDAQPKRLPAVTDFVDVREVIDVQIAPDGRSIAYVLRDAPDATTARARPQTAVWLVGTAGAAAPIRISPAGVSADMPRWAPDSRTLSFVAPGQGGGRQLFVHGIGGDTEQLTRHGAGVGRHAWSPDGATIAFIAPTAPDSLVEQRRRAGYDAIVADEPTEPARIWLLDVAAGTTRLFDEIEQNVREIAWAPSGRELAVVAGESEGAELLVVDRAGSVLRTLSNSAGGVLTRRQILDWSPDGRTILFAYTAPRGRVGHWLGLVPAVGGAVRELLADFEGTIMRAVWQPDSRHVLAQSFEDLASRLLRIDTHDGSITALGEVFTSYPRMSVTRDGRTIAYAGQAFDAPAEVWVLTSNGAAQRRTNHNPQIRELQLGDVRPFRWTNPADGTRLSGVLVTPPDYRPGQQYPTITHLHGGPHFHWGLGWLGDWHDWAQLLATNGYVVFLPNPRGSTGRSWEFASAIIHDLGGVDVQDVLSGVDALIAAGIADEDRLGVGGFSYGGFLTAATITQTPRFRAAIVAAGITNLGSFVLTPGNGPGWAVSFFPDHIFNAPESYQRRSPQAHVRKVTTPTLVLHGEQDPRIRVDQAWEFYNSLRLLGVATQLVVYPRAGHGISERAHQIDYLSRILGWYDQHLKVSQ
jgi:dipeptidyl aminopeptidase/acylaminoacyl peptidase